MQNIKFILLTIFFLFIASSAYAQLQPIDPEEYGLPGPAEDIEGLVNSIVYWIAVIAGPACLVALIYGGIRYAFSGGNEEKVEQAKRVMKYATIGVAIIIGAYAITQLIIALIQGEVPEPPTIN